MTVSTTNDYDPNIDVIVKGAMVMSGLMNPNQSLTAAQHVADAVVCRELLSDILDALPSRGVTLRMLRFVEQTLVAGTYKYTLDADVLDVIGGGMYIEPGEDVDEAAGETFVTQVSQESWHRLSAKDSSGLPTQMFAYKGGSAIELRFWPIPDAAGTVRFQAHTKPGDSINGSDTVDLNTYWREYLKYELAHRFTLGKGGDLQRAGYFHTLAEQSFKAAKNKGQSRVAVRASCGHNVRWRR